MPHLSPLRLLAALSLLALISSGCEQRMTGPTPNPAKPSILTSSKTCGVQGSERTKSLVRSVDKDQLLAALSEGKYALKSVTSSARPDQKQVSSATLIYTLPDVAITSGQPELDSALKAAVAGVSCQKLESDKFTSAGALLEAPMIIDLPSKKISWLWTLDYQIEKSKEVPDVMGTIVPSTASVDEWTTEILKTAKLKYSLISDSEFEITATKEIAREGKPTEVIQARYRYLKLK